MRRLWAWTQAGRLRGAVAGALIPVVLAFAVFTAAPPVTGQSPAVGQLPGGVGTLAPGVHPGYVGSAACGECHASQAAAWATSQHAMAMARAEPATVRGDFSDVSVEHKGSRGRFFRDGGRFMVETEGRDGKPATFAVSHTFGIEPLQQYLVTFPDGRVQALPWAWDTRPREVGGQRWFHLYADQPIPAADPLHWTRGQQNWNYMCAECHSTGVRKAYDPASDTFKTTFSEISVGCEACHGQGSGHVAWARQSPRPADPARGFAAAAAAHAARDWKPDPATGSPAPRPATPTAGAEIETCARCHSRRGILSEDWQPGRPIEDTHLPVFLTEGLFEADGQMRDEVFNDHSFRQSLMHARGVTCTNCHDPHSQRLKAAGADVCGQCHDTARFASTSHTGHAAGPGMPDCVSCHMPARTYMVVDRRHDHSFRIPRPDVSAKLGTPNACNDCHADRTAAWAAEAVERWHGPARKGFQTWAEPFAAARRGDPGSRDALLRLAAEPTTPAIVRATAQNELARLPSAAGEAAARAGLKDPAPMVRIAAARNLAGLPDDQRRRALLPLAGDPVRAVRIETARLLAGTRTDDLPPAERAALLAAFTEFEAAQRLNADRPENRAALAAFFQQQGRAADAEAELVAGLKRDPAATGLAINLADLYRVGGREAAAEQVLRQAVSLSPQAAAPRHALGLSLVRQKRYADALTQLAQAAELDPSDPRFAYVYGVALQSLGKAEESRGVLRKALENHPWNAEILGALMTDALRRSDAAGAAPLARRLSALRPDDAELARIAARLSPP